MIRRVLYNLGSTFTIGIECIVAPRGKERSGAMPFLGAVSAKQVLRCLKKRDRTRCTRQSKLGTTCYTSGWLLLRGFHRRIRPVFVPVTAHARIVITGDRNSPFHERKK